MNVPEVSHSMVSIYEVPLGSVQETKLDSWDWPDSKVTCW